MVQLHNQRARLNSQNYSTGRIPGIRGLLLRFELSGRLDADSEQFHGSRPERCTRYKCDDDRRAGKLLAWRTTTLPQQWRNQDGQHDDTDPDTSKAGKPDSCDRGHLAVSLIDE